jgi:hypothetical protein
VPKLELSCLRRRTATFGKEVFLDGGVGCRSKVPVHEPANFPPYNLYPYPPGKSWVPSSGALCSAKIATADKEELLLEDYIAGVSQILSH